MLISQDSFDGIVHENVDGRKFQSELSDMAETFFGSVMVRLPGKSETRSIGELTQTKFGDYIDYF